MKNKRAKLIKKGKMLKGVEEIRDGVIVYNESNIHSAYVTALVRTTDLSLLSPEGILLRTSVLSLRKFFEDMEKRNKPHKDASNFITEKFLTVYEKHGNKIRDSLAFGLFNNLLDSLSGRSTSAKGDKVMNFYMMLHSISPQAFSAVSANLRGPNLKNLRRHIKIAESDTDVLGPIINRHESKELCAKAIVENHKRMFSKSYEVAFSLSGDGTKTAAAVSLCTRYNAIVGGAAPHHFISIPQPPVGCQDEEQFVMDFIHDELEKFNGDKPTKKKAAEINLATLTYQNMEGNVRKSPFFQVCGRPQTKNQASTFNEDMADACKLAETELRKEGYPVSFISFAADGVSASSNSLQTILRKFLEGKLSYSAHTDTNHNMKNGRYQYIIGGNNVKTIGSMLIDTGLLKVARINQDLWRIKDFASDLLVLKLASATTAASVFSVQCADTDAAVALATVLFFKRVHLFAVNSKGCSTATERVVMLWSSFIFMLHIDGVHPTTKRNLMLECISMSFMILRSDVFRPSRITTEPSEHSIALIRKIIPEGTVKDFVNCIGRIARLWIAVTRSALHTTRKGALSQGYADTIDNHSMSAESKEKLESGPVKIETDQVKIQMSNLVGGSGSKSVSVQLWKELMPLINQTNGIMIKYLQDNFNVKELHPMTKTFKNVSRPIEILEQFDSAFLKTDQELFKFEANIVNTQDSDDSAIADNSNVDVSSLRDRMVHEIVSFEKEEGNKKESELDKIELTDEDLRRFEEVHEDGSKSPFNLFMDVITLKNDDTQDRKKNVIFECMQAMAMGKREKGNTSSLQKTKSLLSRWFGVKKEPKKNSEGATVIERGSVIQIAAPNEYFIVFEVWKTTAGAKTKYGKWFPSPVKDNPKWPAEKQSLDKYRFGVREVILDENKVALKSGIVDGRDVRKTYRLFEFSQVKTLLFKVDGL